MTTDIRLGSLVIGSTDPERLSAWYRAAFAPSGATGTVVDFDAGRLIFDRRGDVKAETQEPGRILINLYVADVRAVEAHLTTLGVDWVRPVEPGPPGLIGTVRDPDGNYVQVVELAVGH